MKRKQWKLTLKDMKAFKTLGWHTRMMKFFNTILPLISLEDQMVSQSKVPYLRMSV